MAVTYIVARTGSSRPSLQHALSDEDPDFTWCGLNTTFWSRAYMHQAIEQILCKKCKGRVLKI